MKQKIIASRLNNHKLTTANPETLTPGSIVSWMGAIQAQDFNMGKWAIGARLPKVPDRMIEDSLNKGEIIQTHILRPTWHFVAAEDIHWMLELSAPRVKVSIRSYDKELELIPEFLHKAYSLITKELQKGQHLTRVEMSAKFAEAGIEITDTRLKHIMFHAELEGIVCNGTVVNKKQTYCLLEEKVKKTGSLSREEALEKLARKYFQSHSPATFQDFLWWSGLTTREARLGMELIRHDFWIENIDGQEYWFKNSQPEFPINANQIHLLPAFDEYFVSYKDRKHILTTEHHKKVIVSNGVFRPMIIKGGEIIGTWKRVVRKHKITAEPELFSKQSNKTIGLIEKAAAEYELFNSKD
ncbi:MAG: winged helix DNA-binding domain-containing protein [Dysgonomonas sp.]|nr:winged helix DNA-binding domain-containing protein [Dysgonomonas sp.]